MPITEGQREQRKQFLGSSDMAAVLNVDRWRTPYDVFLDKTGQLEDAEPNDAMLAGTWLEDGVLRFAESKLGGLIKNQQHRLPDFYLGANIDAVVAVSQLPVEAKTAGLFSPLPDAWGNEGTDEVPDYVVVQCHVHMICMPTAPGMCYVAALLGWRGFQMFEIGRNEELCELIRTTAKAFWENHILAKVPPPDSEPHLGVVRRVIREPNKIIPINPELVEQYERACAEKKAAITACEEAQAAILTEMGDAEGAEYGVEGKIVTFMEQSRKGYTVEPKTYRVFRIQKDRRAS